MFKLQVVLVTPSGSRKFPQGFQQGLPNQSSFLPSSNNTFQVPSMVTPVTSFFNQTSERSVAPAFKKFLLLTRASNTLLDVAAEISKKFRKLYPDESNIQIEKLQDSNECDLDPDYKVSDVFDSNNILLVLLDNDFKTSSPNSSAIATRISSLNLNQQDTPNLKAPGSVKRKAEYEYFDSVRPVPIKRSRDSVNNSSIWRTTPETNSVIYRPNEKFRSQHHPLAEQINAHSTDNEHDDIPMNKEEEEESYRDELEDAEVVDDDAIEADQSNISLPPPENETIQTLEPRKVRMNGAITSPPLPSGERITSGMLQQEEHPDLSKLSDKSDDGDSVIPIKKNITINILDSETTKDESKIPLTKEQIMSRYKEQKLHKPKVVSDKSLTNLETKDTKTFITPKTLHTVDVIHNTPLDSSPAFDGAIKTLQNVDSSKMDISMEDASMNSADNSTASVKNDIKTKKETSSSKKENVDISSSIATDKGSEEERTEQDKDVNSSQKSTNGTNGNVTLLDSTQNTSEMAANSSLVEDSSIIGSLPPAELNHFNSVKQKVLASLDFHNDLLSKEQALFDQTALNGSSNGLKVHLATNIKLIHSCLSKLKFEFGKLSTMERDLSLAISLLKTKSKLQLTPKRQRTKEQEEALRSVTNNMIQLKRRNKRRGETTAFLDKISRAVDQLIEISSKIEATDVDVSMTNAEDAKDASSSFSNTGVITDGISSPAKVKDTTAENVPEVSKRLPQDKMIHATVESSSDMKSSLDSSSSSSPSSSSSAESPAPKESPSESAKSSSSESSSESSSSDSEIESDSDDEINLSSSKKKPRVVNAPKGDKVAETPKSIFKNPKLNHPAPPASSSPLKMESTTLSKLRSATTQQSILPPLKINVSKIASLPSLTELRVPDVKDSSVKSPIGKKNNGDVEKNSKASDSSSDSESDDDSDSENSDSDDSDSSDDDSSSDDSKRKDISKRFMNPETLRKLVSKIPDIEKRNKRKSGFFDMMKDVKKSHS